ncbi:MAG: YqiA/YcfP family alpha/beta fold hydrolase [Anaerolineales bacterium]
MDTRQRIIQSETLYGIPTLTIYPKDAENLPVVFYVHGLTSNKRSGIELGDMLAEAGICMVAMDAAMHGERLDDRIRTAWEKPSSEDIYPFESGLDRLFLMFQIVEQTARDMETLIHHFSTDPRMNIHRLGVCGSSMGGFVAFLMAARFEMVQAAVTFISHASFLEHWENALMEAGSNPKWQKTIQSVEAETLKRTAFIRQLDPLEKLQTRFAPKPLLMIVAGQDTDIPKTYATRLGKVLQPFYAGYPDQLRLSYHSGITHRVTSDMRLQARDWFVRFL